MEEIERSAPSVEEAIEAALAELGATEQEVSIDIVQEPKEGFLGVRSHEAVVRVRRKSQPAEVSADDLEDQGDVGAEFLEGLIGAMGMSAGVETDLEGGTMYLKVVGEPPEHDDMGLLIGRHGQTLEALQELTRVVVAHKTGMRSRVVVDVEDYRKRQRTRLEARAREVARRVARTGREEELEPMNPYDRKVVHDVVGEIGGVESASRGEDPDRRVVIRPRG